MSAHKLTPGNEGEMILVDKPLDWTSFDVVKRLRSLLNVRRIGHAGTLDPKATGLLIVCTGSKTKNISAYADLDKEYVGTMELGVTTPSYDSETEPDSRADWAGVTLDMLEQAVKRLEGRQQQIPPMYSAAKYGGKPLYRYARKGRVVHREPKEIEVHAFTILRFAPPLAEFKVTCSKGTYVRSLVHDVGQLVGCGATLRALRRTRIGMLTVDRAVTMNELAELRGRTGRSVGAGHAG